MKKAVKSVLAGLLVALGVTQFSAQAATNIVQNLTIKFTAYYQAESTTNSTTLFLNSGKVSIANKDIIALLGLQLGVVFTSDAKLILISDMGGIVTPRVVVRDTVADNTVDTPAGEAFFVLSQMTVQSGKIKNNPPSWSGTGYAVKVFNMNVTAADFSVQGFGQTSISSVKYQGQVVGGAQTGTFNVSGSGNYGAAPGNPPIKVPVAIKGTVQVSGKNVEVSTP